MMVVYYGSAHVNRGWSTLAYVATLDSFAYREEETCRRACCIWLAAYLHPRKRINTQASS